MLIRKIVPDDNLAVSKIIRTVMAEFGAVGDGYSIQDPEVEAMYEAYEDERSVFYVLEDRTEVVGCGGLSRLAGAEPSVCELKKMYFYESARGRGVGMVLAEMLLVDARRMGYSKAYIETLDRMTAARRLYEKLGFERMSCGLGATGHHGCDAYYSLELEPPSIDPSLLA